VHWACGHWAKPKCRNDGNGKSGKKRIYFFWHSRILLIFCCICACFLLVDVLNRPRIKKVLLICPIRFIDAHYLCARTNKRIRNKMTKFMYLVSERRLAVVERSRNMSGAETWAEPNQAELNEAIRTYALTFDGNLTLFMKKSGFWSKKLRIWQIFSRIWQVGLIY
jgi:hypothetical protein